MSEASEPVVFDRRDFLKLLGIGLAGAAAGCAGPSTDKLIPFLVAPNDIMPGVAYWYASTCRECPAGCGMLVKTREGRAIKVEGNPQHPVGQGGLCARGQAGLQGLYDPDRLRTPMRKDGGAWKPITWDEGLSLAAGKLGAAVKAKRGVALMTDHVTGSLHALAAEWAAGASATHLVYEPFAHESLREANRRTFGRAEIPNFDFARARCVVSFGADFLETWLSPVGQARGFAAMRARRDGSGQFIAVEPRLSLTGANADEWVAIKPGAEAALALGLARVILTQGLSPAMAERGALLDAVSSYTPEAVEQQTEVPAATVERLAKLFAAQHPSLAVAGGVAGQSEQSVALIAAVNLLNYAAGNVGETVRFDRTLDFDAVASFNDVQRLIADMSQGKVDVLVVSDANPVYAVPAWAGFGAAMEKVSFRISLSRVMDETAQACDLILPSTHPLETLGDAETTRGVLSVIQPGMQKVPVFDARPAGDTLIALAQAAGLGGKWPATWAEYLTSRWQAHHQRFGNGRDFDTFWNESLKSGGVWETVASTPVRWAGSPAFASPELKGAGDLALILYPSASLFDGRGANKTWLQELPDPTSKATWGTWVEIHPETAAKIGVADGQPVKVQTEAGSLELPAYLYAGLRKDVIAIPLGQGHTAYGRNAAGRGSNATSLLVEAQDGASGAVAYLSARATIARGAKAMDLVMTQHEKHQHDRGIAQIVPLSALAAGGDATQSGTFQTLHQTPAGHHEMEAPPDPSQTRPGRHTSPMVRSATDTIPAHAITAVEPSHHVRGPRNIPVREGSYKHAEHRWAMAIDLDSCTGCSACVVACSAENNVPSVGPELIKRGREMMWIRIERFEENLKPGASDVRFVPMMCQHCGDAPCETVCPVFATYHNPEGLNAQVYNRCVGTRYCSNNCPYKVRSFNFFDYAAPEKPTFAFAEPLNWQLNPDVTVRNKGVMEKCTMCVQRILEGKGIAKDEGRKLKDGEFQTACAQSCPTRAIVFGDLADPDSAVHLASFGERRYWVFEELNTKPGVTYRKRVRRDTRGGLKAMSEITYEPAGDPEDVGVTEHVPATVTQKSLNADILRMLERPGKIWWGVFLLDLMILAIGGIAERNQIVRGIGVAGHTRPVMWATYVANFVFWVGIAHCGTLVSAILFLFRSHFRRAVYRVAEAMTVFGVMTAGLFPILHLGRPWFPYWLFPYPNQRQIWPNFRSPLEWDVFAVTTYLTVSSVFFIVGLIPDAAVQRDAAKDRFHRLLGTLFSFGWKGGNTQWKHYYSSYLYFAAFATPLVLSVHSVVSWDFAMAQVPGWHSTIFAPYFVAGAIFSGVALVINLLIIIRKGYKLEHIVTLDHIEKLSKLVLLTSTIVGYSYLCEFFCAWYGPSKFERDMFWWRFTGHFWWASWTMFTCNVIFPLLLWFKSVRRNMAVLFILMLFVNVGMWFERFVIIITSLAHPFDPAVWGVNYRMSWTEGAILAGSFAWFGMYFLLFIRLLPAISIAEVKETLAPPMRRKSG